jgi:hypothetical protein
MGGSAARWLFAALYYLLPNLANLSFITPAAHGQLPAATHVAVVVFYSVVYIAVILAAAAMIFHRRNFK